MSERKPKPLSAFGYTPGETPLYCGDCRSVKPMGRPGRCKDCATVRQEIDATLKMPEPAFNGHHASYTIGHLLGTWRLEHRPEPVPPDRTLGWFVLPPFQRPAVWSEAQKVRFLESVWLELPIGVYVYNDAPSFQHHTSGWLIDGQQRIGAILDYVAGAFPVFDYRWAEITEIDRRRFDNRVFPAIVTHEDDEALLAEMYDRLAYGGTPHAPKAPA